MKSKILLTFLLGLASGCTAAQLQSVEASLPVAIRGQSALVRTGGPVDLKKQQDLVVRGKDTAERKQLVTDYRASRLRALAPTKLTVKAVAEASQALAIDVAALEADLQRNDAQIDEQIGALATEGERVTPPPSTAPSVPPASATPATPAPTAPAPAPTAPAALTPAPTVER